jgi:hypothetical protein
MILLQVSWFDLVLCFTDFERNGVVLFILAVALLVFVFGFNAQIPYLNWRLLSETKFYQSDEV